MNGLWKNEPFSQLIIPVLVACVAIDLGRHVKVISWLKGKHDDGLLKKKHFVDKLRNDIPKKGKELILAIWRAFSRFEGTVLYFLGSTLSFYVCYRLYIFIFPEPVRSMTGLFRQLLLTPLPLILLVPFGVSAIAVLYCTVKTAWYCYLYIHIRQAIYEIVGPDNVGYPRDSSSE
jgi:hypothetical protein